MYLQVICVKILDAMPASLRPPSWARCLLGVALAGGVLLPAVRANEAVQSPFETSTLVQRQPLVIGIVPADLRAEFCDLASGDFGRSSLKAITLFKSVGTALEDLAAAELALGGSVP